MVKRKFEEVNFLLINGADQSSKYVVNNLLNDSDFDKNKKVEEFDSKFFEEASKAWKSNKITQENSTYIYKCTFLNNKKIRCNRPLYEYELICNKKPLKMNCEHFCKLHINKKYNSEIHIF